MPSEEHTARTNHSKAPLGMGIAMGASLFGMLTGFLVGSLVGYPEPLSIFGLLAPIAGGIMIQLAKVHEAKTND